MAQEKDRGSELLTQIGEQDGVREKLRRMARQNKQIGRASCRERV